MGNKDCFVIMPISNQEGYETDHFDLIYNDIIRPACKTAGYNAIRATDVKQTNLIHKDILQKLLDSEMVICDLSSNNPNVLFELGIRQAFDKPTVLIKDTVTKSIFDLSSLRYTEYINTHRYRDVLKSQKIVADAIISTEKAVKDNTNINSLIRLLSLPHAATLKTEDTDTAINDYLILQQIGELQQEVKNLATSVYSIDTSEKFDSLYNETSEKSNLFTLISQLKNLVSQGYPKQIVQNNYVDISNKLNEMNDFLSKVEKERIDTELSTIESYIKKD